jgi:PAS domain S-box-containing protein
MMLTPVPTAGPNDRRLLILAIALTIGIFALDVTVPLGITICAMYGIVVLFGLFIRWPAYSLWAAGVATLLTTVVMWIARPDGAAAFAVFNRTLAVVGIWATAWLVWRHVRVGRALDRSIKDLADTTFALDQAAIVAVTNVKGRITYVNDKFVEISGYSREELLGQDHRIINSGLHPKEFFRDLWRTIGSGRIWRGEIRNRAKSGSYYWVDTTIIPFLDDRGRPYQYMAIRYDITERKRSEVQLREQASLARLGEMAAVVAHEVKNPLAGMRGVLQVIGGRMPEGNRDRAILGEVVTRLDALNDIVQDLLVFARPREPQIGPVPLGDLLENTLSLLKRDPAVAGVDIAIGGDNPVIQADSEQLKTVFQNLLLNAVQATAGAGLVTVTIATDTLAANVAIADSGPGIPAEIRDRIFEPFFTTKHRGTGLGLPTARRVIERHRGTLDLECPPSGGTVVTVTLPLDHYPTVNP